MPTATKRSLGDGPRGPFKPFTDFIETPFYRRFQRVVLETRAERTGRVVSAPSFSGKTWGISDVVRAAYPSKSRDGETRLPVLAACAPHNNQLEGALVSAIGLTFGLLPNMPPGRLKIWLLAQIPRAHVEMLVIDDAHHLSIPHLKYLKELIDLLSLPPYEYRIGLCLVAAADNDNNTLVNDLQRPDIMWAQFRNRLDFTRPFVMIDGHSEQEVCDILAVLEEYYRTQLPDLRLIRWSHAIYEYLTHPRFDPASTKRVAIGRLTRFIQTVAESAYTAGLTDVTGDILDKCAAWITFEAPKILHISDDPGPAATVAEAEEHFER